MKINGMEWIKMEEELGIIIVQYHIILICIVLYPKVIMCLSKCASVDITFEGRDWIGLDCFHFTDCVVHEIDDVMVCFMIYY